MALSEREKRFLRRYLGRRNGPMLLALLVCGIAAGALAGWQLYLGIPEPQDGKIPLFSRLFFSLSLGLSLFCVVGLIALCLENLFHGRKLRRILRKQLVDHSLYDEF